jgi:hypothetical protein
MTGTEFALYVKARLNRLDTSAYEDVKNEEILLFGNEALKRLTLEFDAGRHSALVDPQAIQVYLDQLVEPIAEVNCTDNAGATPSDVLKLKDIEAFVTIGDESGWVPGRSRTNDLISHKEDNPFAKSYPDRPEYRVLDGKVQYDTDGSFQVTKFKGIALEIPPTITSSGQFNYPFMDELQNKTVTLLLENLESRRLETQPAVSKM